MLPVENFQIFKGDTKIPKWLSPGAESMLRGILEPNPIKRMTMADIKADEWFKQDYTPADPYDDEDEDIFIDNEAFSMQEMVTTLEILLCRPLLVFP